MYARLAGIPSATRFVAALAKSTCEMGKHRVLREGARRNGETYRREATGDEEEEDCGGGENPPRRLVADLFTA